MNNVALAALAALALVGCSTEETPFEMKSAATAEQAEEVEGSCGEGKCGTDKEAEGTCGTDKEAEGTCGEGKCGSKKTS